MEYCLPNLIINWVICKWGLDAFFESKSSYKRYNSNHHQFTINLTITKKHGSRSIPTHVTLTFLVKYTFTHPTSKSINVGINFVKPVFLRIIFKNQGEIAFSKRDNKFTTTTLTFNYFSIACNIYNRTILSKTTSKVSVCSKKLTMKTKTAKQAVSTV